MSIQIIVHNETRCNRTDPPKNAGTDSGKHTLLRTKFRLVSLKKNESRMNHAFELPKKKNENENHIDNDRTDDHD